MSESVCMYVHIHLSMHVHASQIFMQHPPLTGCFVKHEYHYSLGCQQLLSV